MTRRARGNAQRPGGGPIQSRAHRGAAEDFPFYWDVPRTAKWRDQHGATESDAPVGKTGRLLVWDASVPGNRYRPLEANPALFRVLAELNPTEDNIKRFVQAYAWAADTILYCLAEQIASLTPAYRCGSACEACEYS